MALRHSTMRNTHSSLSPTRLSRGREGEWRGPEMEETDCQHRHIDTRKQVSKQTQERHEQLLHASSQQTEHKSAADVWIKTKIRYSINWGQQWMVRHTRLHTCTEYTNWTQWTRPTIRRHSEKVVLCDCHLLWQQLVLFYFHQLSRER